MTDTVLEVLEDQVLILSETEAVLLTVAEQGLPGAQGVQGPPGADSASALADHVAASDPHPQYLQAADIADKADLVAGKVPASQLPSYVDDVLNYADFASLPVTGESGKIYVTDDNGLQHRWSGSAYITWTASPGTTDALTEGSANKYFTEARVRAAVLTGLSLATNAAITASDSVLSALGKLQKQITDILTALSLKAVLDVVQTWTKAQIGGVTALSVSANAVAVDLSASNNFSLALQATTGQTLSNPTNAVAGQSGQIAITQNATPSTLAFGSNWISVDGATPTVSTTAGAVNLLSYYVVDATHIWFSLNKHGVA